MDEEVGIVINVKAINTKSLNNLVKLMGGLDKEMKQVTKTGNRMQKRSGDWFGGMTRSLSSVSMAMNDLRMQMTMMTQGLSKITFEAAAAGIKIAANTEESNARLAFALTKINGKYDETIKKIDEVSLRTVLTRKDVTDMVSDLAIQRINAFDEGLSSLAFTAKDGSKQAISALETLNDAVAFSGKTSKRILLSVKEAVSEQKIKPGRLLADDLNIGRAELDKWNAALKAANTPQEAFNKLLSMMATRVGGTSDAISGTLNFMLKQFDDLRDKISVEIFGASIKSITGFLQELRDEMLRLSSGGQLKSISDAIKDTVSVFLGFGKALMLAARGLVFFTQKFPVVIPIIMAMTSAIVALTGALAVMSALSGPLLAMAAAVSLVISAVTVLSPVTFTLGVSLGIVAAAIAVVVSALGAAAVAFTANTLNAKGFMDMFDRIRLVMTAVVEAVNNLDNGVTHIKKSTADALDEKGLLGTVKKIVTWWDRMTVAFESFKMKMDVLGPELKKAFEPFLDATLKLADTMGVDTGGGVIGGLSEFESKGVRAATALVGALTEVLTVMTKIVDKTETAIFAMKTLISDGPAAAAEALMVRNFGAPLAEHNALRLPGGEIVHEADPRVQGNMGDPVIQEGLRHIHNARQKKLGDASKRALSLREASDTGDFSGARMLLDSAGGKDLEGTLSKISVVRLAKIKRLIPRFDQIKDMELSGGFAGLTENTPVGKNTELESLRRLISSPKILGKEIGEALVQAILSKRVSLSETPDGVNVIQGKLEFAHESEN